ncbi:BnaCnng75860D, partial [Brassica napus]
NPVEVVKAETLTISEIAAFIKREPAKVAYFDCIATIDDVKHGTEWYYIACKDCQTKLNCGPTTLLCPKCGNENATAVANYWVEMSVYDNEEQCTFIILGDAGKELTGRKATELIDTYAEKNGGDGAELEDQGVALQFHIYTPILDCNQNCLISSFAPKEPPPPPHLNTPAGTEVEISDVATSSGGGTSATDEKNAKRTKRSG